MKYKFVDNLILLTDHFKSECIITRFSLVPITNEVVLSHSIRHLGNADVSSCRITNVDWMRCIVQVDLFCMTSCKGKGMHIYRCGFGHAMYHIHVALIA